jgi:hypothetical protein
MDEQIVRRAARNVLDPAGRRHRGGLCEQRLNRREHCRSVTCASRVPLQARQTLRFGSILGQASERPGDRRQEHQSRT